MTLLELLVKPIREGRFDLVDQYRTILSDAIQLASVISSKGDVFVTNDKGLKRVTEIRVMTLEDIVM